MKIVHISAIYHNERPDSYTVDIDKLPDNHPFRLAVLHGLEDEHGDVEAAYEVMQFELGDA